MTNVAVTFNQPMVEVTSVGELEADDDIFTVVPPIPAGGRFRWLGTTTVQYEHEHRMPYATEVCVCARLRLWMVESALGIVGLLTLAPVII